MGRYLPLCLFVPFLTVLVIPVINALEFSKNLTIFLIPKSSFDITTNTVLKPKKFF